MTGLSRRAPAEAAAGYRHVCCDLLDAGKTSQVVRAMRPEVVIHAQAASDVDTCEREPDTAQAQNVQTVEHLVRALEGTAALFVYVSTDYVFDGLKGSPYDEACEPRPISVYGRSKLAGERAALQHPYSVVVRPSTLFGPGRMNFCDAVAQRAREGRAIEAFLDQTTSPTYTMDVAEGLGELIRALAAGRSTGPSRVYHLTNAGACTRVAFAYRIVDLLGYPRSCVRPIRMAEQKRPAPRPPYSALTTTELPKVIGRGLRPWEDALGEYLQQGHPFDSAQDGVPR